MSAKTSANVEDLFNKILDDLLASQNKKKEVGPGQVEGEKPAEEKGENKPKEEKPLKLGSIDSKSWQNQVGNCCQR